MIRKKGRKIPESETENKIGTGVLIIMGSGKLQKKFPDIPEKTLEAIIKLGLIILFTPKDKPFILK